MVIGATLAGLRAAISAHQRGVNVSIIVKGKLERSGSPVLSDGGYAAVETQSTQGDTSFLHRTDTLRGGGFLDDPILVDIIFRESTARLYDVECMDEVFEKGEEGFHV